jgi:predicted esterase
MERLVPRWSWLVCLSVLAIVIAAMPDAASAQESARERAMLRQWSAAYQQRDWDKAIEIGLELVDRFPDAPRHPYNLACAYALKGDPDTALVWLNRAAEKGFAYPTTFRNDPDLASLRDRPEYEQALKRVIENHEREFEVFKEKADETEPIVIVPRGPDTEQPAPLIIALHGRGGRATEMVNVWRRPAARIGAILVAPQSLDRLGPGYSWDKIEEAEYLVEHAMRYAIEHYNIDESRIILTGFSQGGYLSFLHGLRHPERFVGVIPVASYADHVIRMPEPGDDEARLPRFVIMVGGDDPAAAGARATAKQIEQAGMDVKLEVYTGVGHAFPRNRDAELNEALDFVLEESQVEQDE